MREPITYIEEKTRFLPTRLWWDLSRFMPDLIVSAELGPRSLIAAKYCEQRGIPLVVWSYQSRSSLTSGGWLRDWARNYILARTQMVIGMGVESRSILQGYGIAPERIIDAPNACDQKLIQERLTSEEGARRSRQLRTEIGQGRQIAVIPARLIPLKGIREILEVWSGLPSDLHREWTLVFVGDGPLEPLVTEKGELGVQRMATVPYREIADIYRMADLHIFASVGDVWGLVVNEAMLCGTPTLCSVHAACAADLIREGTNGFLFDPIDRPQAIEKLTAVLRRKDLAAIGFAALETGRSLTPESLADSIRLATEKALKREGPAGLL